MAIANTYDVCLHELLRLLPVFSYIQSEMNLFLIGKPGTGITLYRTIRFKERIQCIGPSEFTGPRESVNVIPNWEECITGNYWAYYTHRVALGDAAHDAGTKLLPRKCRISTMPVSIGMSENPGNRICAIFLPPQYSC